VRDVCGDGKRIPTPVAKSGAYYSSCKQLKSQSGATEDREYWLYINSDPEVQCMFLCACVYRSDVKHYPASKRGMPREVRHALF
jgi:hypothetical protein